MAVGPSQPPYYSVYLQGCEEVVEVNVQTLWSKSVVSVQRLVMRKGRGQEAVQVHGNNRHYQVQVHVTFLIEVLVSSGCCKCSTERNEDVATAY